MNISGPFLPSTMATSGTNSQFYSTTIAPSTTETPDVRSWLTNIIMEHTNIQGSFLQGFIASISVVIVSELGDKTFFIAAIMAMKHPRLIVFAGAISALVFMTVLSAAFGSIATFIPRIYTYYISAALFAIFGIKMLRDGCKMDPNEGQEELEEVQMELKRREDQEGEKDHGKSRSVSPTSDAASSTPVASAGSAHSLSKRSVTSLHSQSAVAGPSRPPDVAPRPPESPDLDSPGPSKRSEPLRDEKEETLDMLEQGQAENRRRKRNAIIKVLLQAATLTFLAEWGDRSQLATVVLATREDVFGVVVGGSLGHALCTGLAVLGGRMLAQRISVRTVTIIGGLVFLFFAVSALFIGPGE